MDLKTSAKTAIKRKQPSAPLQYLLENGLIKGRVLDYGCGRGFDMTFLQSEGYDPNYLPNMPDGQFDTILCTYVLNVVDETLEHSILKQIQDKLTTNGIAYISVRRDKKLHTSQQRWIVLDLPIAHEHNGAYTMYKLSKDNVL